MKHPSKIRVGHKTYTVSLCKEVKVNGNPCWGSVDQEKQDISLEYPRAEPAALAETSLHELFHILWGHSMVWKFNDYSKKQEEEIVSHLSHNLAAVLINNPKYVDYLKASFNKEKKSNGSRSSKAVKRLVPRRGRRSAGRRGKGRA